MFTCARILFLVSLLFVALLYPFDLYSSFKFLIFIIYIYVHRKILKSEMEKLVNLTNCGLFAKILFTNYFFLEYSSSGEPTVFVHILPLQNFPTYSTTYVYM